MRHTTLRLVPLQRDGVRSSSASPCRRTILQSGHRLRYTFGAADALTSKGREGGRVTKVALMVTAGVNADGYREVLGINTATAESGAGWLTFFRDLVARGLSGVGLVTSARTLRRRGRSRPQFDLVLDGVHDQLPQMAEHLEAARDDILAFTATSASKPSRTLGPSSPPGSPTTKPRR